MQSVMPRDLSQDATEHPAGDYTIKVTRKRISQCRYASEVHVRYRGKYDHNLTRYAMRYHADAAAYATFLIEHAHLEPFKLLHTWRDAVIEQEQAEENRLALRDHLRAELAALTAKDSYTALDVLEEARLIHQIEELRSDAERAQDAAKVAEHRQWLRYRRQAEEAQTAAECAANQAIFESVMAAPSADDALFPAVAR